VCKARRSLRWAVVGASHAVEETTIRVHTYVCDDVDGELSYHEGDVPGDEVVGEDGEGGAAERRRVAAHVAAAAAAHHLADAGVRVRVEADVRHQRAVAFQQDVALPRCDGDLLPARARACEPTTHTFLKHSSEMQDSGTGKIEDGKRGQLWYGPVAPCRDMDPDPLAVAVRHGVHRRLHRREVPSPSPVHGDGFGDRRPRRT
jgi:hypothetical protein